MKEKVALVIVSATLGAPASCRLRASGPSSNGDGVRAAITLTETMTKAEKVYLDTTIPSYYFDQRKSLASYIEVTKK